MTIVEAVLNRARSQIGTGEQRPGSNRVPYSDWYGVRGPWCAMFVSWCLFHEGLPLPAESAKGFCYTPRGARARGVGADNPDTSRHLHVFVHEAAKSISFRRRMVRRGPGQGGACGRLLIQRPM